MFDYAVRSNKARQHARHRPAILSVSILFLAVCLLIVPQKAVAATESVKVVVDGLSGREQANVDAALGVPPALIR